MGITRRSRSLLTLIASWGLLGFDAVVDLGVDVDCLRMSAE